jgi:hypothetical protein
MVGELRMTDKIDWDRLHEMATDLDRPVKTLIAQSPQNVRSMSAKRG